MINNLVIVENETKYVFNNKMDAVKQYLGDNYYSLNSKEKYEEILNRTQRNSMFRSIPMVDLTKGEEVEDLKNPQYLVLDETLYLLSLAKNSDIVIFEKDNVDIFTKGIDKSQMPRVAGEYVRVNDCANQAIQNHIDRYKGKEDVELSQ